MGSVFRRRGRKVWTISYLDDNGKRREEQAYSDKTASQHLLAQRERDAARRAVGLLPRGDDRSVGDHLRAWDTAMRASGLTEDYRTRVAKRARAAMGPIELLSEVDLGSIEAFLARLVERGRAPKTVNDYRDALASFGNWLARTRRVEANPFDGLPKQRLVRRRRRRPLQLVELARLVEAARNRSVHFHKDDATTERNRYFGFERSTIYVIAAYTGLRRSEIAALRWCDIDRGWIHVVDENAKSRRDDWIPQAPAVERHIGEWREFVEQFRSVDESKPIVRVPRWIVSRLRSDLLFAGIEPVDQAGRVVDFHALRHTFAQLQALARVPRRVAQGLLRHTDPSLTEQVYQHDERADRVRAIESLPDIVDCCSGL